MTNTTLETYQSRKAILTNCLRSEHQVIFNANMVMKGSIPFKTILCPTCSEQMHRLGFPKGLQNATRFFRYMKRDIWVKQEGSSYINTHTPWDTVIAFVIGVGFLVVSLWTAVMFAEVFYYGL